MHRMIFNNYNCKDVTVSGMQGASTNFTGINTCSNKLEKGEIINIAPHSTVFFKYYNEEISSQNQHIIVTSHGDYLTINGDATTTDRSDY